MRTLFRAEPLVRELTRRKWLKHNVTVKRLRFFPQVEEHFLKRTSRKKVGRTRKSDEVWREIRMVTRCVKGSTKSSARMSGGRRTTCCARYIEALLPKKQSATCNGGKETRELFFCDATEAHQFFEKKRSRCDQWQREPTNSSDGLSNLRCERAQVRHQRCSTHQSSVISFAWWSAAKTSAGS